jgi:hypothetical protein
MHTLVYKGFSIEITIDEFAESPFSWYTDEEIILTYNKNSRYILGNTPVDFDEWNNKEKALEKTHFKFPVYAYIHGSVYLSLKPFNCSFDSGRSGTLYIKKTVLKNYKGFHEDLKDLNSFVESQTDEFTKNYKFASLFIENLNNYNNEGVYFVSAQGNYLGTDFSFECGNYYGIDNAIEIAKKEIDFFIDSCINKYKKQLTLF